MDEAKMDELLTLMRQLVANKTDDVDTVYRQGLARFNEQASQTAADKMAAHLEHSQDRWARMNQQKNHHDK